MSNPPSKPQAPRKLHPPGEAPPQVTSPLYSPARASAVEVRKLDDDVEIRTRHGGFPATARLRLSPEQAADTARALIVATARKRNDSPAQITSPPEAPPPSPTPPPPHPQRATEVTSPQRGSRPEGRGYAWEPMWEGAEGEGEEEAEQTLEEWGEAKEEHTPQRRSRAEGSRGEERVVLLDVEEQRRGGRAAEERTRPESRADLHGGAGHSAMGSDPRSPQGASAPGPPRPVLVPLRPESTPARPRLRACDRVTNRHPTPYPRCRIGLSAFAAIAGRTKMSASRAANPARWVRWVWGQQLAEAKLPRLELWRLYSEALPRLLHAQRTSRPRWQAEDLAAELGVPLPVVLDPAAEPTVEQVLEAWALGTLHRVEGWRARRKS